MGHHNASKSDQQSHKSCTHTNVQVKMHGCGRCCVIRGIGRLLDAINNIQIFWQRAASPCCHYLISVIHPTHFACCYSRWCNETSETNTTRQAQPGHSTTNHTPNRPTTRQPRQQRLNATGCAHAGLGTVNPTHNRSCSTRRPSTTSNPTRRVEHRPATAQPTKT